MKGMRQESVRKLSFTDPERYISYSGAEPPTRTAVGGDDGCRYGYECLLLDGNRGKFASWLQFRLTTPVKEELAASPQPPQQQLLNRLRMDESRISDIMFDCRRCLGHVNSIIDTHLGSGT